MAYRDVVLADGPVGFWFLGDSTTTAVDETGSNNGTYSGTYTQGQSSLLLGDPHAATSFDGATGAVQLSTFALGDGPFTVEAWIKRNSTGTTQTVLALDNGLEFIFGTTNLIFGSKLNVGTYANGAAISDTSTVHHIVHSKNGAASKVYVDGIDTTVLGTNQTLANGAAANSWIARDIGTAFWCAAVLQAVAIYNTVLTPTQVAAHYNAGVLRFVPKFLPRTLGPRAVGPTFFAALRPKSTSTAYAQGVAGALSFAGAKALLTGKALTAVLSFAGTILRAIVAVLAAVLSFAGTVLKFTTRALPAAVLSFVGSVAKQTGKALSAVLSFSGALSRAITHTMTAVLTFAGAVSKALSRALSATLSFAGSTAKRTSRALSGVLSFVGTLVSGALHFLALTGALSFAGSLSRLTGKALAAVLSFAGSISRATAHTMTAVLSFAGATVKSTARALTAAVLSFAGALSRGTSRTLAAVLSFAGATQKATSRAFTAVLSFAGAFARNTGKAFSAVLSFVGGFAAFKAGSHAYQQALSATLSFSGTMGKLTQRAFNATLTILKRVANIFISDD